MDRRAVRGLGVKRGDQHTTLPGHDGLAAVLGQHLDTRTHASDPGRPDEHHLELNRILVEPHGAGRLERLALPAVGVSLDGDVDQPERELLGALDLARQDDETRARAEDRLTRAVELLQRGHEIPRIHELEQGRGLTTRHDEPIDPVELARLADLDRLDPALLERPGVKREVTLEGEHADPHGSCRRTRYQPRVCRRSFSASFEVSIPTMASPRSSLTRASTSASLKCVVACTMALARFAGSLDLKIPDPTKTASAPSCIMSAASAGVAMPPAEKFGTGSLPAFATQRTRSYGAPRFLASVISSSGPSMVSRRMPEMTARMWRTASTMLPEPASPFVRIMAAPSPIRRSASPRSRQPQTKGMRKANLSMWKCSSAGVRTSDSSMKSTPRASRICASTKWPMRALAITGMVTAFWISWIFFTGDMRATPPSRRMSEGTRSSAITEAAPASSAILACSALVTSMMTPPLSISARPMCLRSATLNPFNSSMVSPLIDLRLLEPC